MRLNFVLAVGVLTLLTLPGIAAQMNKATTLDAQLVRLAEAQAEFGATLDPNGAPRLSITLPASPGDLSALLGAR